jgi:hypothetical protein
MREHTTRSLAALAIAAIPTLALAQAAQVNPAAEHLAAARAALNKVLSAPVPAGETFKNVSDMKAEYLALERAASTASPEWVAHYTTIDRLIGELLGASSSKEAGAVGTSGRAGSPAGRGVDAAVAANLENFRTHLKAFSAAMSAVTPNAAPAAAAPPAAVPPATAPPVAAPPAAVPPPTAPPVAAPPASPAPAIVPPASPPAAAPPAVEDDALALLDQVTTLVDRALGAGPGVASDTVSVDRATLEQMKTQLEQIKQRVKKP